MKQALTGIAVRRAARVAVAAALALAATLAVPGRAAASPDGRQFAPSAEPTAAVPAQDLAHAIGDLAVGEYGEIFAGLTIDPKAGVVVVYVTDPVAARTLVSRGRAMVSAAVRQSAKVEIRTSEYARPQMKSASAVIWKLAKAWRATGVDIFSIVLKSDGSGLEVRTNQPARVPSLLRQSAPAGLAVDVADIRYVAGRPAVPTDRLDPSAPWQGGIPIKWDWSFSDWDCTSAFGARRGTTEYLVTAEHCFDQGDVIEDGGDDRIGGVAAENVITDSAIITADASPSFWANDDYTFNFGAAALSWEGEYVCQSGYTSYPNRCNIEVTNELTQWDFGDGKGVRSGVEGRQCAGCNAVAHGDSGGPVWAMRSDGVFTSRGIVSGGHTPVEENVSYEYILFTETPAVLNALNLTLQTG